MTDTYSAYSNIANATTVALSEDVAGASFALKFDEYWDNFDKGIEIAGAATHFLKAASSELAFGTGDMVFEWVADYKDAPSGYAGVFNTNDATTGGIYLLYDIFDTANDRMNLYMLADDTTAISAYFTCGMNMKTSGMHKHRLVFDRDGDYEYFIDNVSKGHSGMGALSALNIGCHHISIGAYSSAGVHALNAVWHEFRASTNIATDSGGPGSGTSPYTYGNTNDSGVIAHWKFREASGNPVDSKNSIALTPTGAGTFTYSVAGAGKAAALYDEVAGVKLVAGGADPATDYTWNKTVGGGDAWLSPGVELETALNSMGLTCLDASSLDWTCNDGLTIEIWLTKTTAAGVHYLFAQNHAVAGTDFGMLCYFTGETSLRLYFQDDTEAAIGDKTWTITGLDDAAIHKLRFWVDPNGSGNATLWIDGASQGTGDFSALVGKTMTSKKFWLGGQYNGGTASFVGTFWFMRITHGLVNSGGE